MTPQTDLDKRWLGEDRQIVVTVQTTATGIATWALSFKGWAAPTVLGTPSTPVVTKTTGAGAVAVTSSGSKEITAYLDAADITTAGKYTFEIARTDAGFATVLAVVLIEFVARGTRLR